MIRDLVFNWCEGAAVSSTEFDANLLAAGFVYTLLLTLFTAWPFVYFARKLPGLRHVI